MYFLKAIKMELSINRFGIQSIDIINRIYDEAWMKLYSNWIQTQYFDSYLEEKRQIYTWVVDSRLSTVSE